jgi:hypothetical protein
MMLPLENKYGDAGYLAFSQINEDCGAGCPDFAWDAMLSRYRPARQRIRPYFRCPSAVKALSIWSIEDSNCQGPFPFLHRLSLVMNLQNMGEHPIYTSK